MQALAVRLASPPDRPWPDRPVSIVLAITDLDVGGAERALVALATRLDRRLWQPTVICLDGEAALADPLRAVGIETICLGVNHRNPARAVLQLASAIRRFRPELVQSFLFHANIAARLAAPIAGRPRVVGGIRVAERRHRWHLRLDRLTSRLSTGSVCVSAGVRRFTTEVARIDPARLTVIPNGVDPLPFDQAPRSDRSALGIPTGATLALFVGRLAPQKGLPGLIEAAARVATDRPDLHVAFVGAGPDREALLALGRSFPKLDGRLHWLGRRVDVPSLLKAADFLVLPSLWEGMPNVVLEAMAARRAVVATAVEGTEDLVIDGRTGWLVPPGDVAAMADALRSASDDPDRLRRYGEAGRDRVEAEFSIGRVVESYERLWAGILGYEWPHSRINVGTGTLSS